MIFLSNLIKAGNILMDAPRSIVGGLSSEEETDGKPADGANPLNGIRGDQEDLINRARAEARAVYEKNRRCAFVRGFAAGVEEGKRSARKDQAESDAKQKLNQVKSELKGAYQETVAHFNHEALQTAFMLASTILHFPLSPDDPAYEGIFAGILGVDGRPFQQEAGDEVPDEGRPEPLVPGDLLRMSAEDLRTFLEDVEPAILVMALRGETEQVVEGILAGATEPMRDVFREEIELLGKVRPQDVEGARRHLGDVLLRLRVSGMIKSGGDSRVEDT